MTVSEVKRVKQFLRRRGWRCAHPKSDSPYRWVHKGDYAYYAIEQAYAEEVLALPVEDLLDSIEIWAF